MTATTASDPEHARAAAATRHTRRHLLSSADLSREQVRAILDTAAEMHGVQQREVKKLPTLRGRTVVNLFFEDSTRTRSSLRDRRQVAVGRRHQHQRQGVLDLQGRVAARHRPDRGGHGGRRPGHPAPRQRRRPPGQPVGGRARHQRRRRDARAPDAGAARRLHDGAPARGPRGPARRHRRRPDPLTGGALQPDHAQDARRAGHPRRAADPDAQRHHGVGAGRGLRAVARLRRGAARRPTR